MATAFLMNGAHGPEGIQFENDKAEKDRDEADDVSSLNCALL